MRTTHCGALCLTHSGALVDRGENRLTFVFGHCTTAPSGGQLENWPWRLLTERGRFRPLSLERTCPRASRGSNPSCSGLIPNVFWGCFNFLATLTPERTGGFGNNIFIFETAVEITLHTFILLKEMCEVFCLFGLWGTCPESTLPCPGPRTGQHNEGGEALSAVSPGRTVSYVPLFFLYSPL